MIHPGRHRVRYSFDNNGSIILRGSFVLMTNCLDFVRYLTKPLLIIAQLSEVVHRESLIMELLLVKVSRSAKL